MDDTYKKAYQREKVSRLAAEELLEKRSRDVQSSIEMIQLQFEDLMRQKNDSDFSLDVAKLTRSDKDLSGIVEMYLSVASKYLNASISRYSYIRNKKLISSKIFGLDDEIPLYSDSTYKKVYLKDSMMIVTSEELSELDVKNTLAQQDITRIVFIPIKCFGKVVTVCEVFLSKDTSFDSTMLDQCQISSYQIGSMLEGNKNRKKLENNYIEIKEKNIKLKKAQSQLVQSEKMASLGLLSAGVAHEINNPIGFVMSNIGTLKEYMVSISTYMELSSNLVGQSNTDTAKEMKDIDNVENFDFILKDIKEIISDCDDGLIRIKDIVANLKSFSRMDNKDTVLFDINLCIENTIKVVWNELKYKVDLTKVFSKNLPMVKGHEGQIGQVIMNILINAANAIEDNGQINIETSSKAGLLKIKIADTGKGMSEAVQAKIFDPFFTTKNVDEGTGLGLSVSYGIIEKHGGEIILSSVEGEGTKFEIVLPLGE
jgi:signal transduction histidine kinase